MSKERELREMEHLLVGLHELIAARQTDSEAADQLRGRMDEIGASLGASEVRLLGELSGDLYMLAGEEVEAEAMRGKAPAEVRAEIASAFGERRWADLLHALRGAHQLPLDRIAYVRARAWSSLGFHLASLKFFEYAYATAQNPNYLALALDEYMAADMRDDAESLARLIETDPTAHPTLLLKASLVLLGIWRRRREPERERADQRIDELIGRARKDPRWSESVPSLRYAGLVARSFVLARRGRLPEAESSLDEAIGISPSSEGAWVARGLLRLDADRDDLAYRDLEEAVRLGARTVWPYYLLSNRALRLADFRAVAALSSTGSRLGVSGPIRAKLLEWRAIALAELGHSSATVLAGFDAAEAENPFDLEIQANAARYRSQVGGASAPGVWQQPPPSQRAGSLFVEYSQEVTPRDLVGTPTLAAA
jgi:tetratricopeptide (TPR) repeat protein